MRGAGHKSSAWPLEPSPLRLLEQRAGPFATILDEDLGIFGSRMGPTLESLRR